MIEPGGASSVPQPPGPGGSGTGHPAAGPAGQAPPVVTAAAGGPDGVLACFETVPAMLWSLEGPHLRVVAANAAARASAGDRPDLLGTPFREVFPAAVLPGADEVYALLERAYATGEPVSGEHAVPAAGIGTWTAAPTVRADGSVRGLAVHVVDCTEHLRRWVAAEEAAAAAEERCREVHASAHRAAVDAAVHAAVELRRTLLPSGVPVLSRLWLAARHRAAEHPVGGDWFDTLPLGDGRVVLLVGDVGGHGTAAAGATGQLRAVAVEAVSAGEEPDVVLSRLDRFAAMTAATRGATLCLAVLDPGSGELVVGGHAHPVPLVVAPDGTTRFLPVQPAWPLGTGGPKPLLHHATLAPGELLLLHTDGLVERPGRRRQDTTAALARVAAATVRDPAGSGALADRVADVVLDRLAHLESVPPGGGYRDDATLLVAHLHPPLAPLRIRLAAEPAALAPVRQRLAGWLDEVGVPPSDATPVLHAAAEAVANVVEHAYGPGADAWVEVRAQLTRTGEVRVIVRDGGAWRDPATGAAGRGRGLLLMREQVDDVGVRSDGEGTTVTLTRRAERPAAPCPVPEPEPAAFAVRVGEGVVRVAGPVDLTTVDRLRAALAAALRGGLRVDLTGVTLLSAAGVRLLHDAAAHVPGLRIVAPPHRPAHPVLLLAGLGDHVVASP